MQMSAELKKEIKVRMGYVSSRDDAMELHRMLGDGIFD
jgi:hypothetical protein